MPSFWLEHNENGQTRQFSFQSASVSIGREKTSGFVLDHPTVSRKHAIIVHKHGSFYLVVLSQSGLTALDGKPVQGEVPLYDSTTLHVGQLEFRFRSHEAAPKPGLPGMTGMNAPAGLGGGVGSGFGAPAHAPANQGFNNPGSFGPQHMGQPNPGSHQNPMGSPGFSQPAGASGFVSQGGAQSGGQFSISQGQGAGLAPSEYPPDLGPTPGPVQQPASPGNDAGIISWDEIASSSEAMLDASGEKPQTIHERLQSNKAQKTNPVLVVFAGALIVGLLYYTFFTDTTGKAKVNVEQIPLSEQIDVKIEVSCLGASVCAQKAQQAYKIGKDNLEKRTVAVKNQFEGYKKLLEAEAYLKIAGNPKLPPEMADLAERKKKARVELDEIMRNYRVSYQQAAKRKDYRQMARELRGITEYFPDRTARENRWAAQEVQKMKEKGIYPKHF